MLEVRCQLGQLERRHLAAALLLQSLGSLLGGVPRDTHVKGFDRYGSYIMLQVAPKVELTYATLRVSSCEAAFN